MLILGPILNTLDYAFQSQPYVIAQLGNGYLTEEFVYQGMPITFAVSTESSDAKEKTRPTVFICT